MQLFYNTVLLKYNLLTIQFTYVRQSSTPRFECTTITIVNLRLFHHFKRNPEYPLAVTPGFPPPPVPQPPATTSLLSISTARPPLDISCKWYRAMCHPCDWLLSLNVITFSSFIHVARVSASMMCFLKKRATLLYICKSSMPMFTQKI